MREPSSEPVRVPVIQAAPSTLGLAVRCFALILVVAALYTGRLAGPFVFDDQQAIVDNASLQSLQLSRILAPPRETPVAGRPLVNLSFAVDRALFGLSPTAFHRTNLIVHLGCTLLLLFCLRGAMRTRLIPAQLAEHAELYAWLIALAFGVHPLAAEIVLYTSQRSEGLVALFYLATFYLLLRAANKPSAAVSCAAWVLPIGILGAASKEVFATALPVALCFDRAFCAGSWRAALRAHKSFYLALSASWLTLGLLQRHSPRPDSVRFFELDYLLAQTELIPRYFAAALWPSQLALDYGPLWPDTAAPAWPWIVGTAMLLLAAGVLAIARPRLGFGAIWIFGILAPSSSLVSIHTEVGAERRFYLPLAAVIAYLVVGLGTFAIRRWQRHGRSALWLAAVSVMALSLRTRTRAADFVSVHSVWQSAVAARPQNARAHYNLAETYRREGDLSAATRAFEAALHAHEAYADAHSNLAGALIARGELKAGLLHLQRAVTLAPTDAKTRFNYGMALGMTGDAAAAVRELTEAMHLRPDSVEIRGKLALALAMAGRADEARAQASWVLTRVPGDATALRVLNGLR